MNKVITINLGGNAYQLEEMGYEALRQYLETAKARLQKNPDRDEILADIELALAEKFRGLLGSHKNVVTAEEVDAVLAQMGPVEAGEGEAAGEEPTAGSEKTSGGSESTGDQRKGPRRLYRIQEGAEIEGVCNGIAAYLNVDPTLVRLAFVLSCFLGGAGIILYIILAFVVPEAETPEEKAAATGNPRTAQEFIRRAREGYYEAMKNFPDRQTRREWKRRFRQEARAMGQHWHHHWRRPWHQPGPGRPGAGYALPFLSLLQGAVTIVGISALISLLATGTIFGAALPLKVPVWVAALVLLVVYGMVAGPLKAARHVCYGSMRRPGWVWSTVFLMDTAVWLLITAAILWMALHFFPELRDAVQSIPTAAHQAADDVRNWWKGK